MCPNSSKRSLSFLSIPSEEDTEVKLDELHFQSPKSLATPLPMKQMFMIGIVTFIEMLQFSVLFPFVYFMVERFQVTDDPRKVGSYVGLIASSFAVAQLITSLPWGFLSDRIGRRPVILFSMAGNAVTCILFGMSDTFWMALLMRSLCGFLNGSLGVTKSMLGEMTDASNRGLAFAIWESCFGLGQIVGPVIGGVLSNPSQTMPQLFGDVELFQTYPYLLPCLVCSSFSVIGFFVGIFYLEETLQTNQGLIKLPKESLISEDSCKTLEPLPDSNPNAHPAPVEILTKNVLISIAAYALWAFIQVIFDEVVAIFSVSPIAVGGLALTSKEMGFILSSMGIFQIVGQILCYPSCERHLGIVKTFQLASFIMAGFTFALPFVNDFTQIFLQSGDGSFSSQAKALLYCVFILVLSGRTIACCLGYVSVMILVNDSCPNPSNLGLVHGFGQVAAAFVRAVGPASGGIIWSWSLTTSFGFPFDAHFTFIIVGFLALGSVLLSFYLKHHSIHDTITST